MEVGRVAKGAFSNFFDKDSTLGKHYKVVYWDNELFFF